ncbi:MAG: helix-hairpin-helix domain-containing protein [Sphingobium sp.]|nr:helix-hairpin-helix domain-containing protein [Sphingobium sp.]
MSQHFNEEERTALLAVKGVGPKVVERLEEMGFASFDALSDANADDICAGVAALLGASCWKNSPQARASINAAIVRARQGL